MSLQAITWAMTQKAPGATAKLLLIALANYCDEDGHCYPSQRVLSDITTLSTRAVRDNLRRLEEAGLVTVIVAGHRKPDGQFINQTYRVNFAGDSGRQNLPAAESAGGRICRHNQSEDIYNPPTPQKSKLSTGSIELPEWLDADAWEEFVAYRKATKHPLPTPHAAKLLIGELAKLRIEGHDPRAVLEQSIVRGWRGVFPIDKRRSNGNGTGGGSRRESVSERADRLAREFDEAQRRAVQ